MSSLKIFNHASSRQTAILLLLFIHTANTDIVDTKTPIVIHDNVDGRYAGGGPQQIDNYFGYSLAFMKGFLGRREPSQSISRTGNDGRVTLFIGAPNEKRATKNSGVVWQCIFNGINAQLSCSILSDVSQQNSPGISTCSQQYRSLYFPENQTEQWIGASLSADSGKLYAGAPRWKINGWTEPNTYRSTTCAESAMLGACYVTTAENTKVLTPLNQPGKFYYLSNNGDTNEYWYLYAELGFSSHVVRPEEKLLLGAPSVRKWRGAVVEYEKGERSLFIHNDRGGSSSIEPHSLLGYTVTTGRARDRGYFIASGAPRAGNLHGVVAILNSRSSRLIASYKGEQFGSYFGFALATADLNGDGYDELLVGAPLYTSDFKVSGTYSTGCVLIFDVSKLSDGNSQPLTPKLCMNSQTSPVKVSRGGRFGSAICSLGDINFDNFEDFAVSAPYDDDGVGTVFVYHGGNSLSEKPAKIIRGKSINVPNLAGFGTSLLSGNHVDIDGNGTPDLIGSSFQSHHVVAFRTRPIARPSHVITFHTANSSNGAEKIDKLLPTQDSFRVRVCVTFQFSVPPPVDSRLDTWIKFELDPLEKRVGFRNPADEAEQMRQLSSTQTTCLDTQLRLLETIFQGKNDNSFGFRAVLWYNETTLLDSDPVQHAVMMLSTSRSSQQDQQYQDAYRSFNSYLPAPIPPTFSRWELLQIAKDNCQSDGVAGCDPDLSLKLNLYYKRTDGSRNEEWKNEKPLIVGQLESLTISIEVSNGKETAYRPTVRVIFSTSSNFEMHPNQLRFNWLEVPTKPDRCSPSRQLKDLGNEHNPIIIQNMRCDQPLQGGTNRKFKLEIGNLNHLKLNDKNNAGEMVVSVDAYPESMEVDEIKSQTVRVPLEGDLVIDIESRVPSTGQSEVDPKQTALVDLTQLYIIRNSGFSATTNNQVKAVLLVPTHVNFDKGNNWTQVIGVANPSTLNIRCNAVNFNFFSVQDLGRGKQQLSNTASGNSRSTRSTSSYPPLKVVHPEKVSVSASSENFVTLSGCEDGGKLPPESCQKIECLMDLPSTGNRELRIQMYLLKVGIGKLVREDSKGIRIDSIISVYYHDKKMAETIGNTKRGLLLEKSVPAWIYLASGAGGTILFLLITFALFKCGFFRRAKKEELKQLKRKTMQQMDANALIALDASILEQEELRDGTGQ